MEWIPHSLNDKADYFLYSGLWWLAVKSPDFLPAWCPVGPTYCKSICFTRNAPLPRYNSRFWTPHEHRRLAGCFHLHLIYRSIQHAWVCAARGTLVVPMWVSAPQFGQYSARWVISCPIHTRLDVHHNFGDSLNGRFSPFGIMPRFFHYA